MNLDRRQWLRANAAAAGTLLAGCSRVARYFTEPSISTESSLDSELSPAVVRALNRTTFGPRIEDVERVARMGWQEYVEEQLHPDPDQDDPAARWRVRGMDLMHLDAGDLFNFREREVLGQLEQATILRAVYSRWQLREIMADFWSNHFNIYARKWPCVHLKVADDRDAIRPHVLGKFRDLVSASVHSPAMLTYLDNQANRRGTANENYARELMELHTLGVQGGYTQSDVQEVARCFTGWSVHEKWRRGQFVFDTKRHDDGAKTVLGIEIPAGLGQADGERVIEILVRHPSTARFISSKLCRRFLGSAPESMVMQLAKIFQRTDGDVREVLRPLLISLADDGVSGWEPIVKRPLEFVASALRALAADTDGGRSLQDHMEAMGQPLFQWPMPDGFPQKTSAWTGSLVARWNFALKLTTGGIKGTHVNLPALARGRTLDPVDSFLTRVFLRPVTDESLGPIRTRLKQHMRETSSETQVASLMLASPQFQWR